MIIFLKLLIVHLFLINNNGQQSNCHHVTHREIKIKVNETKSKIVFGEPVDSLIYPFFVSIMRWHPEPHCIFEHVCGGSILTSTVILTACHCFNDLDLEEAYVRPNYDNTQILLDITRYYKIVSVSVRLPDGQDICLAWLQRPIPFDDTISPISLPTQQYQFGTVITVMGFGLTEHGRLSDVLRHVQLTMRSNRFCQRYWSIHFNVVNHFCASGCSLETPCAGDSGGPAIVEVGGEKIVIGVLSVAETDCVLGSDGPSVYMNVFHYLEWIYTQIGPYIGPRSLSLHYTNLDSTINRSVLRANLTSRIYEGNIVTNVARYIVTFWHLINPDDWQSLTMYCTGVLYKPDIIIATKLCAKPVTIPVIYIRPNLDNARTILPRERYHTVDEIFCHGDPDDDSNINNDHLDICLVLLTVPVDFEFQQVLLPSHSYREAQSYYVQGFGQFEANRSSHQRFSDNLRQTMLYTRIVYFCEKFLHDVLNFNRFTNICAGGCQLQNTCPGDEGGPMVSYLQQSVTLVGLVLRTSQCGDDFVTILLNIFAFKPWIERWANSESPF